MTTLQITPNWKNKTAKFKGTIAAGEHVAVTIQNDNGYVASTTNLRLRVVDPACGRTLAVFPQPVEEGETPDTWGVDTTPLTCELNLNTVQMLKAVPPAATVPLLFVLDDKEADTLHFKDMCDVTHWPMELGEDVPFDLVGYPDFVDEAKQAIKDAQDAIESAVDEATGIVAQATEARTAAQTAASNSANSALQATNAKNAAQNAQAAAETAQGKAETAQGKAETAQEAAETAQGKAEDAQAAAETAAQAAEAALPLDTTLSNSGKAADAKAVGDALEEKYEKPSGGIPKDDLASGVKASLDKADTALQEHQDISGKVDSDDLFTDGKIKSSLLPSYVDDVLEYASVAYFPATGESGKIYVAKNTNKTYRWGGSNYVEISESLALGETSSTAFRGDKGKTAYDHATDANRLTTAQTSGLYKIATTAEGHVKSVMAVQKSDITALGIPAQDTTYSAATTSAAGLMSSTDKAKLDGIAVVAPSTNASDAGKAADAKATGDALEPMLFAQYYPDGSVKSAAEFTAGIKYDAPDTTHRTITVKPFCNTGTAANDNSNLSGRVVIPPFVDASGNGYISDDGTRFKVVGVSTSSPAVDSNTNLTAIVVPSTVTSIMDDAFARCNSLASVSLPSATSIGDYAFASCTSLTSISLPAASTIWNEAFNGCTSLASVDFGATLSSVPTLGYNAFSGVPNTCKIIVPDSLYDAWTAASGWSNLVTAGYKFLRHSEWEAPHRFEVTDLFLKFAPEWASGGTYNQYNLVQHDGALYYKKSSGSSSQTGAPGTDTTNWQPFSSLSDLTQLFLPLTGGTMKGDITIRRLNGSIKLSTPINLIPGASTEIKLGGIERNGFFCEFPLASGTFARVQDIAPTFSTSATYAVGQLVNYNGTIYICHTAVTTADDWTGNTNWTTTNATVQDALDLKADKPSTFTTGNLAALDANGNPTDSGKKPSDFQSALTAQQLANIAAVSDALAFDATHTYAAGDPVVYDGTLYTFTTAHTGAWTGSDVSAVDIIARLAGKLDKSGGTMTGAISFDDSMPSGGPCSVYYNTDQWHLKDHLGTEIVTPKYASGTLALTSAIPYALVTKTITNGAVSLNDRASNAVTISTTLSPNTLTINFPTATSGKVRDFAMRLNIAAGVTAPEIAWPQGVTLENNGGEVPEIADGGTGGSSTILYFGETENNGTTAKFLVKGETLTAIAQA